MFALVAIGSENQVPREVLQFVACLDFVGGLKLARGTTFGYQNRSGGTGFGGGPKFSLQDLHCSKLGLNSRQL